LKWKLSPVNSNVEHKSPVSRKRKRPNVLKVQKSKFACSNERRELIHESLAKLISMNQLPISFYSSIGFKNCMAVVEPNYKVCKQEAMKARINRLKKLVETKIRENLHQTKSIVCTTDGWSLLSQDSYITVTAHTIDLHWNVRSYTLSTHEMEERHTAENLAIRLGNTFNVWEVNSKVIAVVTDNARNIVYAISLISSDTNISSVTCAAHSLQLAINHSLRQDNIQLLVEKCSKLVSHFKHSNIAK